jgi:hypothetical protein
MAQVDAIGGARHDDASGDSEVQRTMLEIVNQLDGFDARGNIKVCSCFSIYRLLAGRARQRMQPAHLLRSVHLPMRDVLLAMLGVLLAVLGVLLALHVLFLPRGHFDTIYDTTSATAAMALMAPRRLTLASSPPMA